MKKLTFIIAIFSVSFAYAQGVDDLLERAEELHNSKPDSSYTICCDAENLAIENSNTLQQAYAKLCKVRFLLLRNRLEECAIEIEKAIHIFQENDDLQGLAKAYISMSNIDGRIKKDLEEIEYLEKANEIFESLHDTVGELKTLSNLALNYIHLGELEKGKEKLIELERLSAGMPEKEFYFLNQNWGIYYREKGNYESALRRFEAARSIASSQKMIDSEATVLFLISNVYLKLNQVDKAFEAVSESYRIASENALVIEQLEALETLNKIHELKGDYRSAYEDYKQITAIKDTIYNLEKINKLHSYEKRVELAEKEKIITEQNLDIERHKNELLKDQYEIYGLTAIVLIISVSVVFLIININGKKRVNAIITKQKEEVELQKQLVEEKNYQILSSITYAKRIQQAILPQDKIVKEYLANSFVFYQAKDIVSGDFYWMEQVGEVILFAAVDCTGHGVPGAFMSIIGNNGLNKAVREHNLTKPGHILDSLNLQVSNSLHLESGEVRDGMDIALCSLNLSNLTLEYAGAFNPLYIIRKDATEVEMIRGSKQAIGSADDLFENHQIKLNKGDIIYVFTDGYADQFGGESGKKFSYKRLRELLIENQHLSMQEQREVLRHTYQLWSKNEEQVDDICVIGVRV